MALYNYEAWTWIQGFRWSSESVIIQDNLVADYCISGKESYEISPSGTIYDPNAAGFIRPSGKDKEYCPTSQSRGFSVYTTFSTGRIRRYRIKSYNGSVSMNVEVSDLILKKSGLAVEKGDKLVKTVIAEDGAYPNNGYDASSGYYWVKKGLANAEPTLTLTTPNNATLYENDSYTIAGTAKDANSGDIVSVWYQIGNGVARAIDSKVSDGTTSIDYSLQLTFKAGKLQIANGTAMTGALAEGAAHKLKVWAEDNKGSKSEILERTFYVVPNRPPTISVNPFPVQSGLIKSDELEVSGTTNDPDRNNVKVAYRLNGGAPVEIHNGPAGAWSFKLATSKLKDGENTIVVEVIDTYNVKVSETFKLDKSVNRTPIAASVLRYQIIPTAESAKSVRFKVRRDPEQVLTAEISMTNSAEFEQYEAMTLTSSKTLDNGVVEDEFQFEALEQKTTIMLKLNMSNSKPVASITGVLN